MESERHDGGIDEGGTEKDNEVRGGEERRDI